VMHFFNKTMNEKTWKKVDKGAIKIKKAMK
jgi:hypothetical protein